MGKVEVISKGYRSEESNIFWGDFKKLEPPKKPGSSGGIIAGFIAIILVLILILLALPYLSNLVSMINGGSAGRYTSTFHVGTGGNSTIESANPLILNSTVQITYPQDYSALLNYSVSLINGDRGTENLSSVVASPIQSAQQHADSMLDYGYFSHWDTQGLKPYMRYTLLNGSGFVEENVAFEYSSLPSYLSTRGVESAISNLESQMMYNDSSCCQNGHRDNILTPYHNRVSIGIAYDSRHVYFVEDFETVYADLKTPIVLNGNNIELAGNTTQSLNPNAIMIFFDPFPTSISVATLEANYSGSYGQGSFVGGVLPPCQAVFGCSTYPGYTTVYAGTWNVASSSIDISFSLANFASKFGSGVYTMYMVQGNRDNPEFLTSISIFIST